MTETANIDVELKIAKLQERLQQSTPLTQMDGDGNAHIVFSAPNAAENSSSGPDLQACFKAIRDNFKYYTTKAKRHINTHFLAPNTEQKVVDSNFAKDKDLQKLAKYLDMTLKNFETNVKRFLPSIKNTDYKLEIRMGGKNNHSINIGFKNSEGKQIGPFLETHITTSPLTLYDFYTINIGYMDKHKQRVYTHSFDYNILNEIDNYTEQRGNKTFLKTNSQRSHDTFAQTTVRQNKKRLSAKYHTPEL